MLTSKTLNDDNDNYATEKRQWVHEKNTVYLAGLFIFCFLEFQMFYYKARCLRVLRRTIGLVSSNHWFGLLIALSIRLPEKNILRTWIKLSRYAQLMQIWRKYNQNSVVPLLLISFFIIRIHPICVSGPFWPEFNKSIWIPFDFSFHWIINNNFQ